MYMSQELFAMKMKPHCCSTCVLMYVSYRITCICSNISINFAVRSWIEIAWVALTGSESFFRGALFPWLFDVRFQQYFFLWNRFMNQNVNHWITCRTDTLQNKSIIDITTVGVKLSKRSPVIRARDLASISNCCCIECPKSVLLSCVLLKKVG